MAELLIYCGWGLYIIKGKVVMKTTRCDTRAQRFLWISKQGEVQRSKQAKSRSRV